MMNMEETDIDKLTTKSKTSKLDITMLKSGVDVIKKEHLGDVIFFNAIKNADFCTVKVLINLDGNICKILNDIFITPSGENLTENIDALKRFIDFINVNCLELQ